MALARHPDSPYTPQYFLSAVGAGGLSISFFMYLLWLTPHKGQPIPSFSTLLFAFESGGWAMKGLIGVALAAIAVFAFMHLRILAWNLGEYRRWSGTEAYRKFASSNAESQLLALPLALAMMVNVLFIVGAVFVPGLWENAEYLFPVAIAAFAAIGVLALRIFSDFIGRIFTEGGFVCARNNSLGQMISVFAFAMIGVGLSAPAVMSHVRLTSAVAFMGAAIFIMLALLFAVFFIFVGLRAIMEHSAERETTPTLWVVIPFVTVVGIALYRLNMALAHNFGVEWQAGSIFAFLSFLFAIQLVFGFLGYTVMKRFGYFEHFVTGERRSAGSYTLICPGVGLFVFSTFVINAGLVGIGVVEKFSAAYFVLYAPLVWLQVKTIAVYFRLNRKLIGNARLAAAPALVAAE